MHDATKTTFLSEVLNSAGITETKMDPMHHFGGPWDVHPSISE